MNKNILLLSLVFIASVRFFSFTLIPDVYFDILEVISIASLLIYNFSIKKTIKTPFVFYVKAIIILTLVSALPAFLFHDQRFDLSFMASRVVFFGLLYFTLHRMNVPVAQLEKLLLFFGIIWSSIMILQQFTYPTVFFDAYDGVTYENGELRATEARGGVNRIMIIGFGFCYFMATYMWQKLREKISVKNLALFALVMIGTLLTQSRQIIFGLILIYVVDTIFSFNSNNVKSIRFTTFFLGLAVAFLALTGDFIIALVELSKEQNLTSGDYIRGLETEFFLFRYWPDPLCYILGNGWDHSNSPYGYEMKEQIQRSMGFHRSDIGLVGALNKFGIIYVAVIIMFYATILIPRKHFIVPKYIRLFFILCALTSMSGANFFELSAFLVPFTCLFYIIDKSNEEYLYYRSNSQQTIINSSGYQIPV